MRGGRAAARAAAEEAAAGALVPDRQGYRSFLMEGAEFLVAESADGQLDLRDVYVTTDVSSNGFAVALPTTGGDDDGDDEAPPSVKPGAAYKRPAGAEGVSVAPRAYQAVPWYSWWGGDYIQEKPGKTWVWRYYLVPVESREPQLRLSFTDPVYMLDGKTTGLQRCEVHYLAPADTPPAELRLRIRDDVITVDSAASMPTWEHAVQARMRAVPALSELEQQRLRDYLAALESARKLGTIDEAEFETAYDVHWLAGMQAGEAGVEALGAGWEAAAGGGVVEGEFEAPEEEDVMGGWDAEAFEDLMQEQYDEEAEEGDFDDFDSPAADY